MTLLSPLTGGSITQRFGPSSMAIQPSMYHVGTEKAYWQPFAGAAFHADVHAGVDFAGKPAGTALVAAEAGTVVRSTYDGDFGGGHVVEVEIKPGVRYSYNHCAARLVSVGAKVTRGQKIATVGATGTILRPDGTRVRSSFGVHCHTVLTVKEKGTDGIWRTMLYDFADFMAGGAKASSSLVKPVLTVTYPKVRVRYPVNLRSTPDLDAGATNIVFVNRDDGLFNLAGQRLADRDQAWERRGSTTNDDGAWVKLWVLNRYVWAYASLVY